MQLPDQNYINLVTSLYNERHQQVAVTWIEVENTTPHGKHSLMLNEDLKEAVS